MELAMSSDQLRSGIERVKGVIDPKASQPILTNVLISAKDGEAIITGFDGSQLCISSHPAEVSKPGSVVVPARMLFEVVRALPEARVSLSETDRHYVSVESGKAKWKLAAQDFEQYPVIDQSKAGVVVMSKVDGTLLLGMIDRVQFAICTEDNRPHLRGAFLESLAKGRSRLTATDGKQLATTEAKIGPGFKLPAGITLATKGLVELKRLIAEAPDAEMELGFSERFWRWTKPGLSLVSGYQEEKYPDWEQVVPKNERSVRIVKADLVEVLKRVSLVTASRGYEVELSLDKGSLRLKAISAE